MMIALLLFVIAAAGVGFYLMRRRRAVQPPKFLPVEEEVGAERTTPMPGEMLGFDEADAVCEPARGLASYWWPKGGAPSLPLPDCTNPQGCRCRKREVADRRLGQRRDRLHLDVALDPRVRPDRRSERPTGQILH